MPKRTQKEFFKITSVARDDLISRGFDASKVDDVTMERLASKMADAYLEGGGGFWLDLDYFAKEFGIPKK